MRKAAPLLSAVDRACAAWEGMVLTTAPARSRLAAALAVQAARTGRYPLAWGSLYVTLFCLLSMALIDRPLALWLKAHVGGDVEGFFKVVTNLGLAGYYLVPSGVLALAWWFAARRTLLPGLRHRRELWAWRCGYLFLSVAISGLAVDLVKLMAGRARPQLLFEQDFYGFHPFSHGWVWNSFPSGHSVGAWAAMTALVVLIPRYDLMWLLIALLVAASRVATTVHFLSDVVAGGWAGLVTAVLLARWLRSRRVDL